MCSEEYCVGLDLGDRWDKISAGTTAITDAGFAFVTVNVSYPKKDDDRESYPKPLFLMPDIYKNITVGYWKSFVVGRLNSEAVRRIDEGDEAAHRLLDYELRTAKFLTLPAILIELGKRRRSETEMLTTEKLAALLDQHLCITNPVPSSIRPMGVWFSIALNSSEDGGDEEEPWLTWHELRRRFPVSRQLGVALEFPDDGSLPSDEELNRWHGEPLRCVILSTALFDGLEEICLSPRQEKFLKSLFIGGCQVCLRTDEDMLVEDISKYAYAMKALCSSRIDESDWLERSARGFVDYLQTPLQPLADHLEASTYAVFEEDPCKYAEYERAVHTALLDRRNSGHEPPFVLMVVGAGRGPLVDASMKASAKSGIPLKLYAVEKNPNAVNVLMRRRQTEDTWKSVKIIACDMRDWKTEERADILVSELLGSFGDNELSPECLDGAQRFLKEDGISIPQAYTSYLAPVQSYKLYGEAKANHSRLVDEDHPLCNMYVVHMKLKWIVAPPKRVFTFEHPNWDLMSNDRHECLSFTAPKKGVLHGFAGYFDTVLYEDVVLSIHPDTHSRLLISWFPVFIPVKEPVEFDAGDKIEVEMWRKSSEDKVWYEYRLTAPKELDVQNRGGIYAAIHK